MEMPDLLWFNVKKGIERMLEGFVIEDLLTHTGTGQETHVPPVF